MEERLEAIIRSVAVDNQSVSGIKMEETKRFTVSNSRVVVLLIMLND